jgi:hypothetical protein
LKKSILKNKIKKLLKIYLPIKHYQIILGYLSV